MRMNDLSSPYNQIIAYAQELEQIFPVEIELDGYDDPNSVHLVNIERQGGRKGDGARALHRLIAKADELGITISLSVLDGSPNLVRYYHRFGFMVTDKQEDEDKWFQEYIRNYDPDDETDDPPIMVRKPR